jgi:hypothetical protein
MVFRELTLEPDDSAKECAKAYPDQEIFRRHGHPPRLTNVPVKPMQSGWLSSGFRRVALELLRASGGSGNPPDPPGSRSGRR